MVLILPRDVDVALTIPFSSSCFQTLRKEALEAYLAGGLKEASIVMQVRHF